MNNRCENCRFWDNRNSMSLLAPSGWCVRADSSGGEPRAKDTLAVALNQEKYIAGLLTHASFGCVMWEAEEKPEGEKPSVVVNVSNVGGAGGSSVFGKGGEGGSVGVGGTMRRLDVEDIFEEVGHKICGPFEVSVGEAPPSLHGSKIIRR